MDMDADTNEIGNGIKEVNGGADNINKNKILNSR
jgi:hypothetical protein